MSDPVERSSTRHHGRYVVLGLLCVLAAYSFYDSGWRVGIMRVFLPLARWVLSICSLWK
jgi:hypothetical protein